MLIASRSRSLIDKLKKDLSSKFEMKDLGEVKKVLDMEIERLKKWQGLLDTKRVFKEGTAEVQHQR